MFWPLIQEIGHFLLDTTLVFRCYLKLGNGILDEFNRMDKAQPVRVDVGLHRCFIHQGRMKEWVMSMPYNS